MKVRINLLMLLIIFALLSCGKSEEDLIDPNSQLGISTTNDVVDRITNEVVGTSTIVRKDDEISMTFETTNLIPGHVYNIIWVIYNNPENCNDDPCSVTDLFFNPATKGVAFIATGLVAVSESQKFSASLKENDTSKGTIDGEVSPYGLTKVNSAEIHLALRSHGPDIPEQRQLQLTTYSGGCTTDFSGAGNNLEVPDESGECSTFQFSFHKAPK